MSTISNPIERTRYLMARSTTFRAWVGITAGTEEQQLAAALAKVDLLFLDAPELADLPRGLVEWGEYSGARQGEGGGQFLKTESIRTAWWAVFAPAAGQTRQEFILAFDTTTRAIVADMASLSGSSDHIRFESYRRGQLVVHEDSEAVIGAVPEAAPLIAVAYSWDGPNWGAQSES